MEWLGLIPIALVLFVIKDLRGKVNKKDCKGQPCPDVVSFKELMQGKLGKTGMVARVENIEDLVTEIREHQKNGGK